MAISALCLCDKRGKEVYFDEVPNIEFTLQMGILMKAMHSTYTMRTDDWGYFQRAFFDVLDNPDTTMWKDYDVFLGIACTAGVTGILWVIASGLEITKFCKISWGRATCGLILCIITLVLFCGGNGFVFYRICMFFIS